MIAKQETGYTHRNPCQNSFLHVTQPPNSFGRLKDLTLKWRFGVWYVPNLLKTLLSYFFVQPVQQQFLRYILAKYVLKNILLAYSLQIAKISRKISHNSENADPSQLLWYYIFWPTISHPHSKFQLHWSKSTYLLYT